MPKTNNDIKKTSSLLKKPQANPTNDGYAKPTELTPLEGEVLADDPKMQEFIDTMASTKESEDMKQQQAIMPLLQRIVAHT